MKILFIILVIISNVSLATEYNIEVVQDSKIGKKAILSGRVISSAIVNLSAQSSGDVIKIKGTEGSFFKKGSVIVELEQETIKAERNSILAEIANAKETLKNSRIRYSQSIISPDSNKMFGGTFSGFLDPVNDFFGRGDPAFDRYVNRSEKFSGIRQAENRLRQAEFKLKKVSERLKDTTVIAPFDGIIITKNINNGDTARTGDILLKFSNIKQLQIEVNIPSRLINNLKLHKFYRVKIDTLQKLVLAELVQIYPIADSNTHSIKVKFNLPKNTNVMPGIYAEIELTSLALATMLIIPKSAILWRLSLPSVFIVNKFNKTELKFIRLGSSIDNNNITVLSGIKKGQRIVTNPDAFITSGISI